MKFEKEIGQKNGFPFIAFSKYYPTRYSVDQEYQDVRNYIYAFKDGRNGKEFAKHLAGRLKPDAFSPRTNWWICIIPASTSAKTRIRFAAFCEEFALKSGMNNGYGLITNLADREAVHHQEDRSSVNILESLQFQDIRGKNILLFDDVYTTGKSFNKVASKLQQLGAMKIMGMFLGKTTWLEE